MKQEQPISGCLFGCVIGSPELYPERWLLGDMPIASHSVEIRFPELSERFGAPRVWAACKARAARGNNVAVAASPEALEVAR